MARKYYYLDLNIKNCKVIGEVNGFPCYNYNAFFPGNFAYPVNAFLTSFNKLKIKIFPLNENITDTEGFLASIKLNGALKEYEEGDVSSPESGKILMEIKESDISGNSFPMIIEKEFSNEMYNFSKTLKNSPKIENFDMIHNYALKIYSLFLNNDITALLNEFSPKIDDYFTALYDSRDELINGTREFFQNQLIPGIDKNEENLINEFEIIPVCEGRIFNIKQFEKDCFLDTIPDKENSVYSIKLFVAEVNGSLKVVR
jgi:hypothetical protein